LITSRRSFFLATAFVLTFLVTGTGTLLAAEKKYNYISPQELGTRIQSGAQQCILDIQVEEEFSEHHIQGAVPTHAYPVKSREDKDRIENEMARLKGDDEPIVIVCPRGAGGAKRTYDYLLERGIDEDRLYILEKGQGGWPYDDLLEKR
jgi:rhodanese-related sulfurtransferase